MASAAHRHGIKRQAGDRALELPLLGFGTAPLGVSASPTADADAAAVLARAWEIGLRHFDTAPQYGCGLAERRLGQAMRLRPRDEWMLSTKVGRLLRPRRPGAPTPAGAAPFEIEFDYSFDGALRSLEDSMQRAGTDRIDLAMIHDVSVKWQGTRVAERFGEAMRGAWRALERLRGEGVVRAVGVGLNDCETATDFVREGDFDFVMIAGRYTLLDTSAGLELLPACAKAGVGVMMAGPFNAGILATGAVEGAVFQYKAADAATLERVRRLGSACERHGVALQAAALQFPLTHPAVTSIVTGFRTAGEVDAAARWLDAEIAPSLWQELIALGLLPEATPLSP